MPPLPHLFMFSSRKEQQWKWDAEQQQAFKELKLTLALAPVLKHPNIIQQFELHTGRPRSTSGHYILIQEITRYRVQPVCHRLWVGEGVRVFDPYLYGCRFLIFITTPWLTSLNIEPNHQDWFAIHMTSLFMILVSAIKSVHPIMCLT